MSDWSRGEPTRPTATGHNVHTVTVIFRTRSEDREEARRKIRALVARGGGPGWMPGSWEILDIRKGWKRR